MRCTSWKASTLVLKGTGTYKNLESKFHKKYKQSNSKADYTLFFNYGTKLLSLNRRLYKEYMSDVEFNIKNNPKYFWILNQKENPQISPQVCHTTI